MKIAIGGLKKNEMKDSILKSTPDTEVIITNDMNGAAMLKNGEVDYYFGACESGGGAAISILIGMLGYSKCATVCRNGEKPTYEKIEKVVNEGKIVFGMNHDKIEVTVPILMEALKNKK